MLVVDSVIDVVTAVILLAVVLIVRMTSMMGITAGAKRIPRSAEKIHSVFSYASRLDSIGLLRNSHTFNDLQ